MGVQVLEVRVGSVVSKPCLEQMRHTDIGETGLTALAATRGDLGWQYDDFDTVGAY